MLVRIALLLYTRTFQAEAGELFTKIKSKNFYLISTLNTDSHSVCAAACLRHGECYRYRLKDGECKLGNPYVVNENKMTMWSRDYTTFTTRWENRYFVCFKQKSLDWPLARESCQSMGGDLAITNSTELINHVQEYCGTSSSYYVGATRTGSSRVYWWDGSRVESRLWYSTTTSSTYKYLASGSSYLGQIWTTYGSLLYICQFLEEPDF